MNLSLPVFLFESIPEAFVLVSLGLTLYGQKIQGRIRSLAIAAVFFAASNNISRVVIDVYHYRTLLNISVLILLMILLLKINPLKALFAALTSTSIFILLEVLLVFFITTASNYSPQEILANVWLRILLPWLYILPLGILSWYLANIGFSFLQIGDIFIGKDYKKYSKLYLAVLILIFAVILVVLNVGLLSEESGPNFHLTGYGVVVLSVLLLIDIFLIYLVVRWLFKASEQEAVIEAQNVYLHNMEELLTTLRAQRHDFINHLEVVSALHADGQYDEENRYLEKMLGEIKKVNSLIRINNPPLSALLKTKQAVAETKGIAMEVEVDCPLDKLPMDSFTLVKILANILDNAIDELEKAEDKTLNLTFERYLDRYIIQVFNTGPSISVENKSRIFEKGFTTKGEGHQGLGLFIAKEIIEQHGGEIQVKSDDTKGTTFILALPMKV